MAVPQLTSQKDRSVQRELAREKAISHQLKLLVFIQQKSDVHWKQAGCWLCFPYFFESAKVSD